MVITMFLATDQDFEIDEDFLRSFQNGQMVSGIIYAHHENVSQGTKRAMVNFLIVEGYLSFHVGEGKGKAVWSRWVESEKIDEIIEALYNFVFDGDGFPQSFVIGKIKTEKRLVISPGPLFSKEVFSV